AVPAPSAAGARDPGALAPVGTGILSEHALAARPADHARRRGDRRRQRGRRLLRLERSAARALEEAPAAATAGPTRAAADGAPLLPRDPEHPRVPEAASRPLPERGAERRRARGP